MRPQTGAHPVFFPCCKHFFWGGFRDDPAADVLLIFFWLYDAARTVSMTLAHSVTCCNTAAKSTYCNSHCNTLQLTLQHTATHIATHCKMISNIRGALESSGFSVRVATTTHCNTLHHTATHCNTLQHTATHCNTLQHTATQCNTLQHTATHCNSDIRGRWSQADSMRKLPLPHTANTVAHCDTLQHTATHCNTL